MELDYYNDYCIRTFESLLEKMDSNRFINQDVRLMGDFTSLGKLKKINGHLNLDNYSLSDFGELIYVKSDIWIHRKESKLTSLNKLEEVGGNLLINGSNISDLGNLRIVKGKVNLRDTKILDLNKLSYVGGDLYLPKRLEGLNLEGIEIVGKVRYWKEKTNSKIELLKEELQTKTLLNFSDIHKSEIKQKRRILSGKFLFNKCFNLSDYNRYTIDNYKEFISFVDLELNNLYEQRYSFYESFYGELKTIKEINDEFPKFKENKTNIDYMTKLRKTSNTIILKNKKNYPYKKYIDILNKLKNDENWNKSKNMYWLSYNEHKLGFSSVTGDSRDSFIYFIENKLLETFSVFIDSLQNKFRVSKGVSKIGEGWVSETDLYNKIKNHFNELKVIQHGKPKWLERQHVDIWIPKYSIGIEYQGLQHDQPIDFFGGEESFKKNQERDERKKRLFQENDSILIEVRPNYDLEDVIKQIESYIKRPIRIH